MKNQKIFIDSWGFISLFNKKETYNRQVSEYFSKCLRERYYMFTSNFVISETITHLYRDLGHDKSKSGTDALFEKIEMGILQYISIEYERMKKALELRYKLKDKPKISFVDLTSFAVMREFEINEVLTMDKHFIQANMGFELKPELKVIK